MTRVRSLPSLLVGLALVAVAAPAPARADGVTLRFAAIAPEGTGYAREIHALSREVETGTAGRVKMKWYLGGIAGDELQAVARVEKKQLDGLAGALFCPRLAPSLWVMRLMGFVNTREDVRVVLNRLRPRVDAEMQHHGFVDLGIASFGREILFTKTPLRTLAELAQVKLWIWSLDEMLLKELPAIGLHTVPLAVEEAAQAYDDGKIEGFLSVPTAALAYQWSARTKYFAELPGAFLPGCIVVAQRAIDQLAFDDQRVLRAAAAKFAARFTDLVEHEDDALLHGLFEHQGLKRMPMSPSLQADFDAAAAKARVQVGEKLLPRALLDEVAAWMTAAHTAAPAGPH